MSGWFQVGNLGGAGLGGALGLYLITHLPKPWMAGAVMALLFVTCCFFLRFTPAFAPDHRGRGPLAATKAVVKDLGKMLKTKAGLLSSVLCLIPMGTGAAQVVLTQAKVASFWGAGEGEITLLQGLLSSGVTALGCFGGGALCQRIKPRTAYAAIGFFLAMITAGMAASPSTVTMYVAWNLLYFFGVGLAYAAFSAFVLDSMGRGSGATKYNVFASLSNFPIWWVGLLLGVAADRYGPRWMLLTESALGAGAVLVFLAATRLVAKTKVTTTSPNFL